MTDSLATDDLLQLYWTKAGIKEQIKEFLADAKPISELQDPSLNPEEEVLKDRLLCRGGAMLLPGTTGAGKSSFVMQACMMWALGKDCFGIRPARPLRSLIVQAENDDGDLWEQTRGVMRGVGFTDEEAAIINDRVWIHHECERSGAALTAYLRLLLSKREYDLVVLDPLFAFIGGDVNSSKDTGGFLRNLFAPILKEYRLASIIVHHTNKPSRSKDTPQWKGLDFAYSGSGSAELANWPRAVMVIRSLGDPNTYELRAAKRGRRVGWVDADGKPEYVRMISHSSEPGTICWRLATAEEAAAMAEESSAPKKGDDLLQAIADLWRHREEELTADEFIKRAIAAGKSRRTAFNWKKTGVIRKVFKVTSEDLMVLTGKIIPNVPVSEDDTEDGESF